MLRNRISGAVLKVVSPFVLCAPNRHADQGRARDRPQDIQNTSAKTNIQINREGNQYKHIDQQKRGEQINTDRREYQQRRKISKDRIQINGVGVSTDLPTLIIEFYTDSSAELKTSHQQSLERTESNENLQMSWHPCFI